MRVPKLLSFLSLIAIIINALVLPITAQRGKPVSIQFGKPNIWSLEQAHYLLSQMQEQSLGIKTVNLADLDPNSAEASRLNLVRQILGVSGELKQQPSFPTPESTPTPTPTPIPSPVPFPSPIPSPSNQLSNTVIEKLLGNPDFLKSIFGSPKFNSSTKLDNHIQLQYEIIAKQLTILRDEVGPDERIIFLELPQSIYTSSGDANNKIVRSYWQIEGYGKLDKEEYIKSKLATINRTLKTKQQVSSITKSSLVGYEDYVADINKSLEKSNDADIRNSLEQIRQNGSRSNQEIIKETRQAINSLEKQNGATTYIPTTDYSLKAVELIPKQTSININGVQEKIKSTFLSGAFSWLFGLGVRGQYERQSDLYEQYLHQEIYSSAFGKDTNLFGWTFGPIPGTKRVAPGIRSTYAVITVPKEAESIVLKARGCYFPRKGFEPPNGINESPANKDWWFDHKRECFNPEQYVLPIPNGGDAKGFWLTGIDYIPVKEKSGRLVASIYGNNFTSQVGILVDGFPLQKVVELTRKLSSQNLLHENCGTKPICGEYEVIDSNEITVVFDMPDDYKGTPNITIIGPGRSVPLNNMKIRINANGRKFNHLGSVENKLCQDENVPPADIPCNLNSKEIPFMFGAKAKNELSITDLKITGTNGANTLALLTGTEFNPVDEIFINGYLATKYNPMSKTFCTIMFPTSTADTITVVVKNGDKSDVKTFPFSSSQFSITNVTPLNFDKDKNEMFIRIEGSSLNGITLTKVNDLNPETGSNVMLISDREVIVKVTKPSMTVKISLRGSNGKEINAVLTRP